MQRCRFCHRTTNHRKDCKRPLCIQCRKRSAAPRKRGLCNGCYLDRDADDQSAEAIERMVAEQMASLPPWWHKASEYEREPYQRRVVRRRPSRRRSHMWRQGYRRRVAACSNAHRRRSGW